MTTGNKTVGVESEESSRFQVEDHVRMNTMDNFRPTTISGDLTIDVKNFENVVVYSVVQIMKSMDDFQPMEMLDFFQQTGFVIC